MVVVTKTATTIKIPADMYNNCLIMYKQTMVSKDKSKWLAAIQDKFNL